jgi:hypothetical protein
MEWWHSSSHCPKKFWVQKSAWKVCASTQFFGIKTASFSLIIFQRAKLPTQSITHLCWCNWMTLWRKNTGKFTIGILFLHNNAPVHRALATQKKLPYVGSQCLDHPLNSLNLTPSNYHLFPGLQKQLKGRRFWSDMEVIAATETW